MDVFRVFPSLFLNKTGDSKIEDQQSEFIESSGYLPKFFLYFFCILGEPILQKNATSPLEIIKSSI